MSQQLLNGLYVELAWRLVMDDQADKHNDLRAQQNMGDMGLGSREQMYAGSKKTPPPKVKLRVIKGVAS